MSGITRAHTCVVVILILAVWLHAEAFAGQYHVGKTLTCSDCHATHASLSHGDSGTPSTWRQTPSAHLTKGDSVTKMCLQCHDNQSGVPDVVGADVNNPSEQYNGGERAAGHFSDIQQDNWKGHNLPGQGNEGPGDCTACHDPHGNANYRNLRALDDSADGPVAFVNPAATGLDRYKRANIGYVKNIGDKLCIRCHEFGSSGNGMRFHRHPSSDATTTMRIRDGADAQHWERGVGSGFDVDGETVPRVPFAVSTATNFNSASTVTTDNEVFCLSCHKAHGSTHAFGMAWPYGTSGNGLASSSGCNQCHNISGD
ncbi:MAG: hypothetical protein M1133_03040 [Armatimonadetes bacterium]|nr:hypothetical protein [Armatimonadota bacterium]